ncbi:hypothetical protein pipiens_002756 [Culex pipiens pipiens]|uniref:Uncharacterized protein n=1 Tax=Culex pipiens pipiens TaxID=38569 RepID=A0ABD1D9M6_CULPP
MEARLQCHTRQPLPTGPDHRECRDHHHDLAKIWTTRRRLHTTKLPALCQLQLQANYIHQLIHGRIVDSPDALAEVYNCLHYFSRDATCKLNSTLQLLCDKVLEMHVTALLDTAPEFLPNRLKDVLQGTLREVEPGVLLMFHNPDKAWGRFVLSRSTRPGSSVQTFLLMASARSGKDAQNLQAPLEFINLMMLRSTEFTTFYREMIDVFSAYWKHRSQIMQRIFPKNEGIERIKKYLLKIVIVSLGKSIGADLLVSLFRSLNDLLVKLVDVPFD